MEISSWRAQKRCSHSVSWSCCGLISLSPFCSLCSQQPLHWARLQHDLRGHQWNCKLHHKLHRRRWRRKLNKAWGKKRDVLSNQFRYLRLHFIIPLIICLFNHRRTLRESTNSGVSEPGWSGVEQPRLLQMTITDTSKYLCFYIHYALILHPILLQNWGQNWLFSDDRVNYYMCTHVSVILFIKLGW